MIFEIHMQIKMSMLIVSNMVLNIIGANQLNSFDKLMSWIMSREAILHICKLYFVLFGHCDDKKE